MTFAHQVKNEVTHNKALINHNSIPLLYGMLLFGRRFDEESIMISTEHKSVARLCGRLIFQQIPMAASVTTREYKGTFDKSTYVVTVDDANDRKAVLDYFRTAKIFTKAQSFHAFIAGAMLSAGNLSDPSKDYHFEIICPKQEMADQMISLMEQMEVKAHCMIRRDLPVVYVKDSQSIEDLLTIFGAHKAVMDMMNVKITKEMRNQANRITNCETSNIMKSAGAAAVQLKDIHYLQESGRLETLPVVFKETALLRLENPEATLRELAEISGVSRSGINHRLKKISELADQFRAEELQ